MKLFVVSVILASLALVSCGSSAKPAATAESIAAGLKAAGMPVGNVEVFTAESDSNKLLGRPNQYIGKATFKDTRLNGTGIDGGGSIETFASAEDLKNRQTYIETITKSMPIVAEYTYGSGLVLLRLSKQLTPDQAKEYEKALQELMKK